MRDYILHILQNSVEVSNKHYSSSLFYYYLGQDMRKLKLENIINDTEFDLDYELRNLDISNIKFEIDLNSTTLYFDQSVFKTIYSINDSLSLITEWLKDTKWYNFTIRSKSIYTQLAYDKANGKLFNKQ